MSEVTQLVTVRPAPEKSVLTRMADRYGVDADKMLATLKATAFKGDVTNEQMMALLVVADQHGLNPWTREIFAFPSRNGIVPVVSVDGWAKIINTHPAFDGMDFKEDEAGQWIECSIHRKDRAHPTTIREWMAECGRQTDPWKSHPRRMLRHKSLIQCARIAFGFAGIFDHDEAERIIEAEVEQPYRSTVQPTHGLGLDQDTQKVGHYAKRFIDAMEGDKEEADIAKDVHDIHVEIGSDADLYVAVQRMMNSKWKNAANRYVAIHRKNAGLSS